MCVCVGEGGGGRPIGQKPISIPLLSYLFIFRRHHRNLLKSLVTMSRMTYFILSANTGNGVNYSTVKRQGEDLKK